MLSNFFMISSLNGSIILAVFLIAFVAIVLYSVLGFTRVLSDTVTVGDPVITYKRIKLKYIVLFIFVIGLIIRFVCAALFDGSIGGMYGLVGAFRMFQSDGLNGYSIFNADTTSQIYPLAFYINSVFGWLGSKFGDDTILYFFMRVPFIMADLGSAFLLYFITKKYINIQSAVIVLALFLLNPLFFINSSIDSRVNSILILALLCTFYFMVKRNVVAMLAFYGVSLLLDRGAQYVFAPIAVYTVYLFVRAIINVKKDGAKDYLKDNSRSPMLLVPLSIIGVFLAMWLVSLPLVKSSMGFNPFKFLVETFIVNIKRYELFGLDALSLYNLFGRNGQALSYNFNGLFFGITFLLLSSIIAFVLFMSHRNRANMLLISAFVIVTVGLFFLDFYYYSLVPFVALLLLSFVLIKDKRILKVFVFFSILLIVNNFCSIIVGNIMDKGFAMIVNISLSVLAVIAHMYFTTVVLDICMTNNRLFLRNDPYASLGEANKAWLKRVKPVITNNLEQ